MMACFEQEGKVLVERDRLTISVIGTIRTDRHCLSRPVGIGSRGHDFAGKDPISLMTSSVDTVRRRSKSVSLC